jgi:hypothetical protein
LELHKSFDFPVSPLSDSISQRTSLFTYHLVCPGYSPAPSSRSTPITEKTPISSRTDYVSSGLGSAIRTDFYDKLATDQTPLTSSRTCHRHVTPPWLSPYPFPWEGSALSRVRRPAARPCVSQPLGIPPRELASAGAVAQSHPNGDMLYREPCGRYLCTKYIS